MTVSFAIPTAGALSQWIGVGGCGCPISASVRRNTRPSFMFNNNAPNSASAADYATNLRHSALELVLGTTENLLCVSRLVVHLVI